MLNKNCNAWEEFDTDDNGAPIRWTLTARREAMQSGDSYTELWRVSHNRNPSPNPYPGLTEDDLRTAFRGFQGRQKVYALKIVVIKGTGDGDAEDRLLTARNSVRS